MSEQTTILHIRNMVCDRCIRVVREELGQLHVDVRSIELGEVVVGRRGLKAKLPAVKRALQRSGFDLVGDRRAGLVEQIKAAVIEWVRREEDLDASELAGVLSRRFHAGYRSLGRLFSSLENLTLEKFIMLQKIERAKELLVYGELTLTEIAYRLGYSSVQHLSNQFKQMTGFSPTAFKRLKHHHRVPLDRLSSPG